MADQRLVEMLAFNFASRTFAQKRRAQGLSRSVSAYSSFVREYLDPVVKDDHCAQSLYDFCTAANNATDLTGNLWAFSKCISQDNGKLPFWSQTVWIPWHNHITTRNFTANSGKSKLSLQTRIPQIEKASQHYLRTENFCWNYIPKMAGKLNPFYKQIPRLA